MDGRGERLSCVSCDELLTPPVMQCYSGHLHCRLCSLGEWHCLVCGDRRIVGRNLFADASTARLPCRYRADGCQAVVAFRDKREHEKSCPQATVRCLFPDCPSLTTIDRVAQHLNTHQMLNAVGPRVPATREVTRAIFYSAVDSDLVPRCIRCFGQMFLEVAVISSGSLFMWVAALEAREEAERFTYTITIEKDSSKLSYSDAVSAYDARAENIQVRRAFILHKDTVPRFKAGDNIFYTVDIHRRA